MAIQQVNSKAVDSNEPVIVDINDTTLAQGEEQEIDLKEDWQAKSAPPPANRYALKLFVDDDKVEQGTKGGYAPDDPNGKFYRKGLTCKIQDPTGAWQDSIVFFNASSGVRRGMKVSTMQGLLGMMKAKFPKPKMTDLELTRFFVAIIKKFEPVLVADCDWSAWDIKAESKRGGDFGEALLVGMKNFPKKADGTHNHIVHTKKGEEIVAKLKIVKWLGKQGEVQMTVSAPKNAATPNKQGVQAPKQQAKQQPEPVVVEEVLEQSGGVVLGDDGEVSLDM